jgi:hypothetical protein
MTKTEAKKLLNDFLDIINGFKSNVESVHISNYLDDPNRTIKFDDDPPEQPPYNLYVKDDDETYE